MHRLSSRSFVADLTSKSDGGSEYTVSIEGLASLGTESAVNSVSDIEGRMVSIDSDDSGRASA